MCRKQTSAKARCHADDLCRHQALSEACDVSFFLMDAARFV